MSISAALQRLVDLDRIDREITRLNAEVAALPTRIGQIETQLAGAKAKLDASHARIKAIESDRRKHELDVKETNDKIAKLRSQSSSVKTNEQYKALLHEISYAEQEISKLEDAILEGMETADSLAPHIRQAEAEYAAEAQRVEDEKRNAKDLTELDKRELAKFQAQRTEMRNAISAEAEGERWLMHYDRVAKGRGTAVALASDSRCTACHVSIRPQTWNQILNGQEIVSCDSCSRILWTKDEVVRTEESLKREVGRLQAAQSAAEA
ncbi:MAG: hypothetical protein NVS9B15_22590 [Acidobacteriaceae bacterium]